MLVLTRKSEEKIVIGKQDPICHYYFENPRRKSFPGNQSESEVGNFKIRVALNPNKQKLLRKLESSRDLPALLKSSKLLRNQLESLNIFLGNQFPFQHFFEMGTCRKVHITSLHTNSSRNHLKWNELNPRKGFRLSNT